jgi:hypothetical protein
MKVRDIVRVEESVKAKLSNRQTRYQNEIDNRGSRLRMIMTCPCSSPYTDPVAHNKHREQGMHHQ